MKGGANTAFIKCPECGQEIYDKAASCPNCGALLTDKQVKVHFCWKQSQSGSANFGSVIIDGETVGSPDSTEFDVMLNVGTHHVIMEANNAEMLGTSRSNGAALIIPADAKAVRVDIERKQDLSAFVSGGMAILIGEVSIER